MDIHHVAALVRTLSERATRRGVLGVLAAWPLVNGLGLLLDAESAAAHGRRKRRKKPHHHRKHTGNHKGRSGKQQNAKQCKPQSTATVCLDRCGPVQNNCQQTVNCGACACDASSCSNPTPICVDTVCAVCSADHRCPSGCCDGGSCVPDCGACRTCDGSGQCVPDVTVRGQACGEPMSNFICKTDGACAANTPPVALDNAFSADEGVTCLQVTLSGVDDDGQSLSFSIVTPPTDGELTELDAGPTQQTLCYKPFKRFFHGSDSFTYTAFDGFETSAEATISITIQDIH